MRRLSLFLLAAFLTSGMSAFDDLPDWAATAPAVSSPALVGSANAVVRMSDTIVTIEPNGTFVTERRMVIEILRNEGAGSARCAETYNAAGDKVLQATAWIFRQGRVVEQRKQREWTDFSANAAGAIIDETRRIAVDLSAKAVRGDLFVTITRTRTREFLGDQFLSYTPSSLPRANLRVQFQLPAGWTAVARPYGPLPAPVYAREGNIHRWVLPDTPYVPEESHAAPPASGVVISLTSPGGVLATFRDWSQVGQYIDRLQAPRCDTSAELQAKVRALTADCADEPARIRALGRYVQDLRYVAINRNLSIGHGFQPRLASEVFRLGYGDCKDKATLLRAMLREAGIRSHLMAVWLADGALIDESVASPGWFNHAILAVELGTVPELWRSAVFTHAGRDYLVFDPTNRLTVMGDIAGGLQGTRGFLSLDADGVMVTLPERTGADGFSLQREIKVHLAPDIATCEGSIKAVGQLAAGVRAWIESSGTELDMEKLISYQMSDRFRQAKLGTKRYQDDLTSGLSQLVFSCAIPGWMQRLPGDKAVVKFDFFSHRYIPTLPENVRQTPVGLSAAVIHDDITVELEAGLEISDLPKSAELESPFGRYSLQISLRDSRLVVQRHYELFRQVVPVADYPKLKDYLARVAKADRSAAMVRFASSPGPDAGSKN